MDSRVLILEINSKFEFSIFYIFDFQIPKVKGVKGKEREFLSLRLYWGDFNLLSMWIKIV